MLSVKKQITLTGSSSIDGTDAETYNASVNSKNPEDMTISSWTANAALRKEHKDECRADRNDFEDQAYEMQDELIASLADKEE